MKLLRSSLCLPASFLMAVLLTGCPNLGVPVLEVNPGAIHFNAGQSTHKLFIHNQGGQTLTWEISEVSRAGSNAPWVETELPWLSYDQSNGETTRGSAIVTLQVIRTGLPVGVLNNTGLRVSSNGGEKVIPVSLVIEATLVVNPNRFNLGPNATSADFTITNTGTASTSWELLYLESLGDIATAVPLPGDFITQPAASSTITSSAQQSIAVEWEAGRNDFDLYMSSPAGSTILRFRFGAPLEGLTATPNPLTLYIETTEIHQGQPAPTVTPSVLRIRNTSTVSRNWTLQLVDRANPETSVPITLSRSTGTTAAADESTVNVAVNDVTKVRTGSGNYDLLLTSGDDFLTIPLIVEVMPLPEIAISEPPQTTARPDIIPLSVLDFGRDEVRMVFWIANVGTRGSRLYFKIHYADQLVENPLIAAVTPMQGDANGPGENFYLPGTNILIPGVPVSVVINRANLRQDVEFRTITVEAVDSNFENPLEAVATRNVLIRVERQPLTIQGALNRSRPPYVMRFVFMARDSLAQIIPTRTEEDRSRLTFSILENDVPLDMNETSVFLSNEIRMNLVVMLDFTGSIYTAGTSQGMAPGEAVNQMKTATRLFLDDLPTNYSVALMYYNDRQQQNRLIHQFSTDRESLKTALEQFTLPPAQFGASDIYDALIDGISLLDTQDPPELLPFDDADVRALVFITDGEDNASVANISDVISQAEESRVQLFPIAYKPNSDPIDIGDLITMAKDSGGYLYTAENVRELVRLLGSERDMTLGRTPQNVVNRARFTVENIGTTAFTWAANVAEGTNRIGPIHPASGSISAGNATTLSVVLNVEGMSEGDRGTGLVRIRTTSGPAQEALARIRFTVVNDPTMGLIAGNIQITFEGTPGTVWRELQNQFVLTYITPKQDNFTYQIQGTYTQTDGTAIQGTFMRDALAYPGDIRAGQIALYTDGLMEDFSTVAGEDPYGADIWLRTDYVPRNVTRFAFRFILGVPAGVPLNPVTLFEDVTMQVSIAGNGLLSGQQNGDQWRLLPQGDGVYILVTDEDNYLPYGAFGNLLRISLGNLSGVIAAFDTLGIEPDLRLGLRVDNDIYVATGSASQPSDTKFFLYPGGPTNPERQLSIRFNRPDLAAPAQSINQLAFPGINPEAPGTWDRDGDGIPDFDDPAPDNPAVPGNLVVPNPVEISELANSVSLTLRNNRLDTYEWQITPGSIPFWIANISFGPIPPGETTGEPEPISILHPGETEQINLHVDRTGLAPGSVAVTTLEVVTDLPSLNVETIPVTLLVSAP